MTAEGTLTQFVKSNRSRRGFSLGLVVGVAAVAFVALIGLLVLGGRGSASSSNDRTRLLVMAAAGLREPVEEIAAQYERENGVHVDIQFGGSNSLLNQLQVDRISTPDLFLAADESYTQLAVASGLAEGTLAVATQRPVVIVRKGSAVNINSLDDLLVDGLRLSLGDPEQAAIGRTVRDSLTALSPNRWTQLEQQVARWGVFKPTVNDVAADVQIGAVDAGIVWDTTVSSPAHENSLNVIELPDLSSRPEQVTLAVLLSSKRPGEAWKFARYLTDPQRGAKIFGSHGFGAVHREDAKASKPEPAQPPTARRSALDEVGPG